MMMGRAVSSVLAVALMMIGAGTSAPAVAQQPCQRGSFQPSAGVDIDAMRCQIALGAQRMGELERQLVEVSAALHLAGHDLARAAEQNARQATEIEGWKSYSEPLWKAQ